MRSTICSKENIFTALAIGVGAVLLAPVTGQVLRPVAKAAIKGGIIAYQGIAEIGGMAGETLAEAQAELAARGATSRAKQPD